MLSAASVSMWTMTLQGLCLITSTVLVLWNNADGISKNLVDFAEMDFGEMSMRFPDLECHQRSTEHHTEA